MSRKKRREHKRGPHENVYAKYSHASEVAEEIARREKGLQIHLRSRGEERKSYDKEENDRKENKEGDETRIQKTIPETPEKKPEGLIKILYVTSEPHDDKVEERLRKVGFECCVFYTRKEAEDALPKENYAGVFIENLRIGLEKEKEASYSNGIELARSVKAAGLPLVVLAEDVFNFINRVKGIGKDDRIIQKPSDSGYYVPAAKLVFKKVQQS
jgi:hypothetical protein